MYNIVYKQAELCYQMVVIRVASVVFFLDVAQ